MKKLAITYGSQFAFTDMERLTRQDWIEQLGVYADTQIYRTVYARTSAGLGVNPTHHHWRFLLASGIPLIKRELIASNPEELPDVYDYIGQKFPKLLGIR
jgi:hypothetical protein